MKPCRLNALRPLWCAVMIMQATACMATTQMSEHLIYEGKRYTIPDWPLLPWLEAHPEKKSLFPVRHSACWRGCVGFWKIEGDRFLLNRLYDSAWDENLEFGGDGA